MFLPYVTKQTNCRFKSQPLSSKHNSRPTIKHHECFCASLSYYSLSCLHDILTWDLRAYPNVVCSLMEMFLVSFVLLPALAVCTSIARPGLLQLVILTAAVQPKGGPCFDLKSVGCFFKRARQRGGHTAREGMRSFFKAWMNQLFCEHIC